MGDTKISWTMGDDGAMGKTWNPIRGCSRTIAAGAKQSGCGDASGGGCYAERTAGRFGGPGQPYDGFVRATPNGQRWTGVVRLVEKHVTDPLRWKKPRRIFVNSMADLFHENLPDADIDVVFAVMSLAPQHTFQILTKRAARMRDYFKNDNARWARIEVAARKIYFEETGQRIAGKTLIGPMPHVWLGVSIENQEAADERIPELLSTPAAVRFLSCEPLIAAVDLTRIGEFRGESLSALEEIVGHVERPCISWVIVGCESGPWARRCEVEWLRSLRDQCATARTPFFLKQAERVPAVGGPLVSLGKGSKGKGRGTRDMIIELPYLDGVQHSAFPAERRHG